MAFNADKYSQYFKEHQYQPQKWYSGDKPTSNEVLGRIGQVMQVDQNKGIDLLKQYQNLTMDSSSSFYDVYSRSTNQAVSNLAAYGIDTSNINDDWFAQNDYLRQYLTYSGTTNNPTKPGKKASDAEKAAYEYYQIWKAEETTKKAEEEWKKLQEEISYWAQRTDRNYSDDEILGKINWNNYKTLVSMDENKDVSPVELNRSIGYSKDAMKGVIWAARNGGSTGSNLLDQVLSIAGEGKQWEPNQEISERLDPNSDRWNPYLIGSTMEKEGLHFGVNSFDDKFIEENKGLRGVDNNYSNVVEAEDFTKKAENAAKKLKEKIDQWIVPGTTEEKIQRKIESLLDDEEFSCLRKLEKSLKTGDLVATTRAINYDRNDINQMIRDRLGELDNTPSTAKETSNTTIQSVAPPTSFVSSPAAKLINMEGQTQTDTARTVYDINNEANRDAIGSQTVSAPSAGPAPEINSKEDLERLADLDRKRAAYDSANGAGAYDRDIKAAIEEDQTATKMVTPGLAQDPRNTAPLPTVSDEQDKDIKQKDATLSGTVSDLGDSLTPEEQNNYEKAPTTGLSFAVGLYSSLRNLSDTVLNNVYENNVKSAAQSHFESTLPTVQAIYDYKENERNLPEMQNEHKRLELELGNKRYYGLVEKDEFDIDYNGEQYRIRVRGSLPNGQPDFDVYVKSGDEYKDVFDFDVDNPIYQELVNNEKVIEGAKELESYNQRIRNANAMNLTEKEQQDAHQYQSLGVQIEDTEKYLADNREQYEQNLVAYEKAQNDLEEFIAFCDSMGIDTSSIVEEDALLDYVSGFGEYQATQWNQYNPSYGYQLALERGNDKDSVYAAAKQGCDAARENLKDAESALKTIEDNGIQIPANYKENIERYIAKLNRDIQDYEYFVLQKEKDFDSYAAKGKEIESQIISDRNEKYHTSAGGSDANLLWGHPDTLRANLQLGHYNVITEEEKDTYYYLLAKDKENGTNKAQEYLQFLDNNEYGVLNVRAAAAEDADTKERVASGAWGFWSQNIMAIVAAPYAALGSLFYNIERAVNDEEFNPKSSLLALNRSRNVIREQSAEEIQKIESPILRKLAQGGYEILTNRADSAMNAMAFSWIFGGIDNEVIREFLSATPMGLTAATDAAAKAKERGATDAQASIIAASTFFAETATEAISLDNMLKAFTLGEDVTARGIKQFVKNWLSKAGVSEMFGESVNDIIENLSDELVMGDLSEHEALVASYRGKGLSRTEAEAEARKDEIAGILHTAIISYLSPGLDVFSYGAGQYNAYRTIAKERTDATNGLVRYSWREVRKGVVEARKKEEANQKKAPKESGNIDYEALEQFYTPNTTQNGEGNFNLGAMKTMYLDSAAKIADAMQRQQANRDALARDYSTIRAAFKGAVTDVTAALTSVFTEGQTEDAAAVDEAKAVAVQVQDAFGEGVNGAEAVASILGGAAEANIPREDVKQGLVYAALGGEQSQSYQVANSEEFKIANPRQKAEMLAQAAAVDRQNQAVQEAVAKGVYENRVYEVQKQLMADDQNSELNSAKAKKDAAEEKLDKAQKDYRYKSDLLDMAREELKQKTEAMNDAVQRFLKHPTHKKLTAEKNTAVQEFDNINSRFEEQFKNPAQEAKAEVNKAQQEAKQANDEYAAKLREQATAIVEQEDQQRAADAAALAEQQAAAQEEQAKAQAEEDERTGKAQEDRENDLIETALDTEGLQGEDRDKRRQQLQDQRDKIKFSKVRLGDSLNTTEGLLAIDAFARKTGIQFKMADMPFEVRGQYVYDKENKQGVIYLNQNRIKSGKMSVGQALVEAALHEITHSMQNLGTYTKYRSTVLGSLFGIQNGMTADELYKLGETAGETNDPEVLAARKYRAKVDEIMNQRKTGVTKENLNIEQVEQEIIADFARTQLNDRDVIQRFLDAGMGGQMRNALHNINQSLKNFFDRRSGKSYQQYEQNVNEYNARKTVGEEDQIEKLSQEDFYQQYEYLRRAERLFQKALRELAKTEVHPDSSQFSVQQMADSMKIGMTYNDETLQLFLPDGREVDGVNVKITPGMIVNTPVGMLINMGLSNEEFTDENGVKHTQQGDARQMFADLMNLCARYKDNNLIWEIAGSEFAENFSALKSNSDPQYKNTVDFGTICAKTQAIVDVISGTMLERIAATRKWNEEHPDDQKVFTGLDREDIMMIYDKTHNAQLSVPCPVCYVFSRWMGVPSLLGQMNRFQHEYVVTQKDGNGKTIYDENGDAMIDWEATKQVANNYIKSMLEKYGSKDKIADTKTSLNNKINTREENLPKLGEARIAIQKEMNQKLAEIQKELDRDDLDKKTRGKLETQLRQTTKKYENKLATNKRNIEKNLRETDQFMRDLREVEAFNWVTQALCLQHTEAKGKVVNDVDENGDYIMDTENFRLTPEEILFDLNRTGEFAGYKKNWKYRTTRGAGMGKAIMPYSGSSLGDIINGEAVRWQKEQNPFLNMNEQEAIKAFESAKERVRKQNLVGGQRFQSTSDFRPEWGLDYVMSFLEMQALGSKVQMYTKVAEAVDFLGSIGADVNLSIMAQGNGYHEATAEEIEQAKTDPELRSRMGTLDGKTYVMEFSGVTGMDYNTAKAKTKKFNNVQMILVGMNDMHIRLAMANGDIDFIIPWHSSGNSKDVLQQLVGSVGEILKESSDYTDTQTDQIKSHKEGKGKSEKTIDDRTDLEIARWNARLKILTGVANKDVNLEKPNEGGFGTVTIDGEEMSERDLVYNDPWLSQLYNRFYVEGVDADCYGVKLPKAQAEQIFPYEYWDKNSTRENADVNGKRFSDYCDRLGLVPRFSQFKNDPGYWKLLIDRKMYDNNVVDENGNVVQYGKYRDQKVVDVTKARMDTDQSQELDAEQARKAQVYQLPESTTAKYGKEYSEQTKDAIYNANAMLERKYDGHGAVNDYAGTEGPFSTLGDETEADWQLRKEAEQDYRSAAQRGDIDAMKEDMDFVRDSNPEMAKASKERIEEQKAKAYTSQFAKEYAAWGKQSEGTIFTLGRTHSKLIEKGIPDCDIIMTSDTFIHDLINGDPAHKVIYEEELYKQLPTIINDPILAMWSTSVDGRIVLFGEVANKKGEPVLVAMEGSPTRDVGNNREYLEIASAYVKDRNPSGFIKKAADAKKIIFVDENRIGDWSRRLRLQLPSTLVNTDSTSPSLSQGQNSVNGDLTSADLDLIDSEYMAAVDSGNEELQNELVDRAAKEKGLVIFDNSYPTIQSLYEGLKNGELLVHARRMNPDDVRNMTWLEPTWAETMQGTEAAGYYDEMGIEPPNLVFASDDTTWSQGERNGLVFVRKDDFQRSNGDGTVTLPDGSVVPYELSPMADYESELYREEPFGIEGSDWYTNKDVEVVAAMPFYAKSADPITYDDNGNVIPVSERFDLSTQDRRYSTEGEKTLADLELENEERLNKTLVDSGVVTQEDVDAYNGKTSRPMEGKSTKWRQAEGPAQRQFGGENGMLQESDELDQSAIDYVQARNAYFPDTNADQVQRAVNWIRSNKSSPESDGYAESLQKVTSKSFDYRSADGQARMVAMMGMAVARNDVNAQVALADAFNRQGTDLGRSLQSRKLFRLMTPEGRIATLQKMLQNSQEEMNAKGQNIDLKFSDWIYQAAAAATEEGDFQKVQQAAAQELAEQIPANWKDKVRSLRMLSMLGNPRTHIRNIIGNALFVPAVSLKNKIGAMTEIVTKQDNRTKTLRLAVSKDIRNFAKQDAVAMKDTLTGEAKYNENSMVEREQKAFKGVLQALMDFNSNALEAEDWFFLKGHYARALGGWMQANGYTVEQVQNDQKLLEEGRAYAVEEAQKATYRDFNKLAQTLNKVSREGGVSGFLVDAVLPFKKTPANILRRGIEYSPVGIAKSLTADAVHLKQYLDYQNGKLKTLPDKAISPNQFIDKFCSGLAGTAIMAVGFLLNGVGAVSCGLDDDDDKLEKLKGNQEYAIKFNLFGEDVTFTMDWAAPMSMPFFVGAAIREQFENQGDVNIEEVFNAIGNMTEPVFNLSMLDGINTLFKTSQYDDTNTLTQIGAKIASNYVTSYVPSILGATARTIDDTRRKNFVESGKGTGIMGTFRYAMEQTENKIPGLSQTNIPSRDVWGNEEKSGLLERILENFVLPGYINQYKSDPVVDELGRLYDLTGNTSMIPKDADKTITFNNEKHVLSAKEWDKYQTERGQTAYNLLGQLMNNPYYQQSEPDDQAALVKSVWDYAIAAGKKAVFPEYEMKSYGDSPLGTIIKDFADKQTNQKITDNKKEMIKALDMNDYEAYDTMIEALHEQGVTDESIKNKIADTYRDQYKDAYRSGNWVRMAEIEQILDNTGYSFNVLNWEKAVDKEND